MTLSPTHPLNYVSLASQTEGYSAVDLSDLVDRGMHEALIRMQKTGSVGLDEVRTIE
jgi:peroxin-1